MCRLSHENREHNACKRLALCTTTDYFFGAFQSAHCHLNFHPPRPEDNRETIASKATVVHFTVSCVRMTGAVFYISTLQDGGCHQIMPSHDPPRNWIMSKSGFVYSANSGQININITRSSSIFTQQFLCCSFL